MGSKGGSHGLYTSIGLRTYTACFASRLLAATSALARKASTRSRIQHHVSPVSRAAPLCSERVAVPPSVDVSQPALTCLHIYAQKPYTYRCVRAFTWLSACRVTQRRGVARGLVDPVLASAAMVSAGMQPVQQLVSQNVLRSIRTVNLACTKAARVLWRICMPAACGVTVAHGRCCTLPGHSKPGR